MQPIALGHSAEQPAQTPVDGPAVPRRTGRRSTSEPSRSPRHARVLDRKSALKSLAAELSEAAATLGEETPISASALFALTEPPAPVLTLVPPADEDADALAELRQELTLTGHRDTTALRLAEPVDADLVDSLVEASPEHADSAAPMAAPIDEPLPLRVVAQLEQARAEADVLAARVTSEQSARAEAERRLADAQDELRFLRAEMQMVGQKPRRGPGRVRRALRVITFRRRPTVPAGPRKSA